MAEKEYDGNPFEDSEKWLDSLPKDTDVPVEALRIVFREALKTHELGRLSIRTAGWMLNFALEAERKKLPLGKINMNTILAQMNQELGIQEVLASIRPDDSKSTVLTKSGQ